MARKRRYADVEEFAERIELYFQCRKQDGEQPTIGGLCRFLGFADRHALSAYAGYGDEFAWTVSRARLRMEIDLHERLIDPKRYRPALIFQLRNNYGWRA